jgi:hypothetical protein
MRQSRVPSLLLSAACLAVFGGGFADHRTAYSQADALALVEEFTVQGTGNPTQWRFTVKVWVEHPFFKNTNFPAQVEVVANNGDVLSTFPLLAKNQPGVTRRMVRGTTQPFSAVQFPVTLRLKVNGQITTAPGSTDLDSLPASLDNPFQGVDFHEIIGAGGCAILKGKAFDPNKTLNAPALLGERFKVKGYSNPNNMYDPVPMAYMIKGYFVLLGDDQQLLVKKYGLTSGIRSLNSTKASLKLQTTGFSEMSPGVWAGSMTSKFFKQGNPLVFEKETASPPFYW